MLSKSICAAIAVLAGLGVASAADLPVKAKPSPFLTYPYDGSGFYWGLGTFGEAQNVKVATPLPGTSNNYAAGAGATAILGYQRALGTSSWVAVELDASYATTGINSACAGACSIAANFSAGQKVKLGGPITALLSYLPNLSTEFPVLPPTPTGPGNPSMHSYVMLVAHESQEDVGVPGATAKKFVTRLGFGAGILTQIKAGMVIDYWAEYTYRADAFVVAPGTTAIPGGQGRAGMSLLW